MTTAADPDWPAHARRLADTLAANGDLHSPRWRAAVANVPRHQLVPAAFEQSADTGKWVKVDTADTLDRVYSPETLVTTVKTVDGATMAVSSSTKPDLMVRMLEVLDVHDEHRVLEIGTGTGYNAALLSHRLSDRQVFSVDVDPEIVALARARLAVIGYHPTLAAVDGVHGLPEHAPYDRIIATCSVPAVPWAWAEQLARGGAILVDLKLAVAAGNLVLLRRTGDRLEGRFTARWAAFMAMRTATPAVPITRAERADGGETRTTTAPATPWSGCSVPWFLAQLRLPARISFGYVLDPDTRRPAAATLSAPDGSWATRSLGDDTVTQAGPTPLWDHVEWGYSQWYEAGQPLWDRLGLTVRADGTHTLWVDDPASPSWEILPRPRK